MQPLTRQLKTLGLETSFKRPHLRRGGWGAHSVGWACAGVQLGQGWVLPAAPCNVLGAGTGTCRVFPVAIGLAGSRSSQRCPDLASCPCLAAGLQHPRMSPCQASVGLLQPPAKLTKRRCSWAVHGPIPSSGCTGSNSQLGGGPCASLFAAWLHQPPLLQPEVFAQCSAAASSAGSPGKALPD